MYTARTVVFGKVTRETSGFEPLQNIYLSSVLLHGRTFVGILERDC